MPADASADAALVAEHVAALLPAAPARVVEIGCGPTGGFVPGLRALGHHAVGIDPDAPDGPAFLRARVEDVADQGPVDVVVAQVSLHHVADLGATLDRAARWLVPGGGLVVLEWSWERFGDRAARWCFDRLPPGPGPGREGGGEGDGPGWLARHRGRWERSGLSWERYLAGWARDEGLPTGAEVLRALDARFTRDRLVDVPYFSDLLAATSAADEQAAMDAGELPATAWLYCGRPNPGRNP